MYRNVPKRTDARFARCTETYRRGIYTPFGSVHKIGSNLRYTGLAVLRGLQGSGNLGENMIEVTVDMKIVSVANIRMHWAVKARLVKSQRQKAFNALCAVAAPIPLPCTIVLTRVAPRALDGDNLQSAFKATRDGVADWLGVDDGDKRLDWQYRQRSDGVKVYRVEIEVI